MLRYAFILCVFLIQCGIQGVYADEKTSPVRADVASLMPNIEKYIEQYRDIFQTPGMTLVVVKDGKVYIQSFGTLSLSDNTPVDADTVFQMASVTKNFTATLITILAQKGILSLDDKVKKYLPDFELADKNISDDLRIRDLLCHCVGLDDFAGDSLWHGNLPQEEVVHNMRYLPFKAKFRETYGYSNIMVGIAGIVVEKATGKPLAKVMQEEIYDPLGMEHSSSSMDDLKEKSSLIDKVVGLFSGKNKHYAKPHDLYDGKAHELGFGKDLYVFPGTSGVSTTANDMGKWLLFHLNNYKVGDKTFIQPGLVAEMRKAYVDGSENLRGQQFPKDRVTKVGLGLGWFLYDFGVGDNRINTMGQMGGSGGTRALITIVPEENMGIAVLANLGGMRSSLFPEAITHKFLDMYLNIDGTDYAKKIHDKFVDIKGKIKLQLDAMRLKNPMPPAPLNEYAGDYKNTIYGDVRVSVENNGKELVLLYRGNKASLKHLNGHKFICRGTDIGKGFESDDECIVDFGIEDGHHEAYGLMISLLDEGENPAFYRQPVKS